MAIMAYGLLGAFLCALGGMGGSILRERWQQYRTDRNVAASNREHRIYRVTQRAGVTR